jgi:magnesium-transporting ATPase (P-type)
MLSTCHGLSVLDEKLVGDPLELRLFQTSGCNMTQVTKGGGGGVFTRIFHPSIDKSWKVVKRFDFNSEKMRSGAAVRRESDGRTTFHVKGSPEAISKIVEGRGLPDNFTSLLNSYTRQGLRVLAFAFRTVSEDEDVSSHADQASLEKGLEYGGLILLANKLKEDTNITISKLKDANVKVAMITGDHVRTAVAVSYNCGILLSNVDTVIVDVDETRAPLQRKNSVDVVVGDGLDLPLTCTVTSHVSDKENRISIAETLDSISSNQHSLAITGRALHTVEESENLRLFSFLVGKAAVFARMDPEDKSLIVETLGDGVSKTYLPSTKGDKGFDTFYSAFCGLFLYNC